ncbi:phospholipase A1 2-like isoform X2 [Planococcus citri]|uniref:phospholipase A1 2-like isoform X2 n=1 Tax=Planococcus citri TaxID=170843 RepID=UPI0031F9E8CE
MKVYHIGLLLGYMTLFQIIIVSKCEEDTLSDISDILTSFRNWISGSNKSVIFLLMYTRESNSPIKLDLPIKNNSLLRGKISKEKPLVLIIHGFISDGEEKWTKELVQAYLKRKDAVVGVVDWSSTAKTINYFDAVDAVPNVADQLIRFIKLLIKEFQVKPKNIHIIGHSLGAHIAGNVGKGIASIHRITGLDPAGIGFIDQSSTVLSLSKTDATFVDVAHTNSILGNFQLLGSVDFFINDNDRIQPGCNQTNDQDTHFYHKIKHHECSHRLAIHYFIESINNSKCLFVASETKERANKIFSKDFDPKRDTVLGLDTFKYKARGKLYITTNKFSPYCRNTSSNSNCD